MRPLRFDQLEMYTFLPEHGADVQTDLNAPLKLAHPHTHTHHAVFESHQLVTVTRARRRRDVSCACLSFISLSSRLHTDLLISIQ